MDALLLMVICFAGHLAAYHTYERFVIGRLGELLGLEEVPIRLLLRKRGSSRDE